MKRTWTIIASASALMSMLAISQASAQLTSKIARLSHAPSLVPIRDIGRPIVPFLTFTGDTTITFICAPANDTATIFLTITEFGNHVATINRVFQTDSTDFIDLKGTLPDDSTWNPSNQAQPIDSGQIAVLSLKYPVPIGQNDTVLDSVIAIDAEDDTIGGAPLLITIINMSCAEVSTNETSAPSLEATIFPTNDGRSLQVILPPSITAPVNFELVNVLGESVLHETFSAGTQIIDASSLPRGVYFYRLTSGAISQSGKVLLGE